MQGPIDCYQGCKSDSSRGFTYVRDFISCSRRHCGLLLKHRRCGQNQRCNSQKHLKRTSLDHHATRDIQLDFKKKRPAVVTGAINEVNMNVV